MVSILIVTVLVEIGIYIYGVKTNIFPCLFPEKLEWC